MPAPVSLLRVVAPSLALCASAAAAAPPTDDLVFSWHNGTCDVTGCTGTTPTLDDCLDPWAGCPCPAGMPKGCQGCDDWPGGMCQHKGKTPQHLVIGFPGELANVFLYQHFTRFVVHNLTAALGKRVYFEWVPGHWASCRTNKYCRGQSQNGNHSYRTCMKAAALHIMGRVRAKWKKLRTVTLIGHSAGTTAMLELYVDSNLGHDWTVDRMIFLNPGTFNKAVNVYNDTQKLTMAQRAARDGTQPVAVYDPGDGESRPAAANIEQLWVGAVNTTAAEADGRPPAPFLDVPVPSFGHSAIQDNKGTNQPTFQRLAQSVLSAWAGCTLNSQCAGHSCVNNTCLSGRPL